MQFNATVKSVKADVAADGLAFHANKMPVGVVVTPRQLDMSVVLNKPDKAVEES